MKKDRSENLLMFAKQYGGAVGFSGVTYTPTKNPLTDPFPVIEPTEAGDSDEDKPSYNLSDRENLEKLGDGLNGLNRAFSNRRNELQHNLNASWTSLNNGEIVYEDYVNKVSDYNNVIYKMKEFNENALKAYDKLTKENADGNNNYFFTDEGSSILARGVKRDENKEPILDTDGNYILVDNIEYLDPNTANEKDMARAIRYSEANDILNKTSNTNVASAIIEHIESTSSQGDYNKKLDNIIANSGKYSVVTGKYTDSEGVSRNYISSIIIDKDGKKVDIRTDDLRNAIGINNSKVTDKSRNASNFLTSFKSTLDTKNLNSLKSKAIDEVNKSGGFTINTINERLKDLGGKSKAFYERLLRDIEIIGSTSVSKANMSEFVKELTNNKAFIKGYKAASGKSKTDDIIINELSQRLNTFNRGASGEYEFGEDMSDKTVMKAKAMYINQTMDEMIINDVFRRVGISNNISTKGSFNSGAGKRDQALSFYTPLAHVGSVTDVTENSLSYELKGSDGDVTTVTLGNKLRGYVLKSDDSNNKDAVSLNNEGEVLKAVGDSNYTTSNGQKLSTANDRMSVIPTGKYYATRLPSVNGAIAFNDITVNSVDIVEHFVDEKVNTVVNKAQIPTGSSRKVVEDMLAQYIYVKDMGYTKSSVFKLDGNGDVVALNKDNNDELKVAKTLYNNNLNVLGDPLEKDIKNYLSSYLKGNKSVFNKITESGVVNLSKLGNLFNIETSSINVIAIPSVSILTSDNFDKVINSKQQDINNFGSLNSNLGGISDVRTTLGNKYGYALNRSENFYSGLTKAQLEKLNTCLGNIAGGTPTSTCQEIAAGAKAYAQAFYNSTDIMDIIKKDIETDKDKIEKNRNMFGKFYVKPLASSMIAYTKVNKNTEKTSEYFATNKFKVQKDSDGVSNQQKKNIKLSSIVVGSTEKSNLLQTYINN